MTANIKTKSNRKNIIILISFLFILFFKYIPAPTGLSIAGMQLVGIFIGILLLWLTISIDWPSLLCLAALAFVPGLKMSTILTGSFGNSTFAFLMFTFMCTYSLSKTPFVRRCAVAFVTSQIAKKGPWHFAILFFASVIFIGCFMSPTVLFVIYLPIIEEIYSVLKLEKGNKIASMLMIGLVICCGISSGMTPIAHVFSLMAMGYYQTATKLTISYASYMGFAIPVGLISAGLMVVMFRFILNPDMSIIKGLNLDSLKEEFKPMERAEKLILLIFAIIIVLWVAPGLIKPIFPTLANYVDSFGTALPPLLGVVALSIITDKGKPLMNFGEAMSKGVTWVSLIMCASTLALGSAITNTDIGLTKFLSASISPLTATLIPIALVLLFTVWAALQTNLSSNMVTVTVVTAIAIPITLSTKGAVSTPAVVSIIGMMAAYAFATPPAMPCVAIAGGTGWTNTIELMKYGFTQMFMSVLVTVFIGYPIAVALMG